MSPWSAIVKVGKDRRYEEIESTFAFVLNLRVSAPRLVTKEIGEVEVFARG